MAKGTEIIVSAAPRGLFREGTIAAGETPKPGIIVQMQVSSGIADDGSFTYEIFNQSADGVRPAGPLFILLPDRLQGRLETAAYAAGERCFVYTPMPGEEFNMLIEDVDGTGDDFLFGAQLMIDDGTGKLLATSSPEIEPFASLEVITDPTADTLAHVIYTGY